MSLASTCLVATAVAIAIVHPSASGDRRSQGLTGYTETIPGASVTFDMVPIEGGIFTIGSPPTERGRAEDEGPAREVTIHSFWMAGTEVTWDEYDVFAFSAGLAAERAALLQSPAGQAVDAVTRPTPPYGDESFGHGKGRQPAISMTWHAAAEYARWVSLRTGKIYRLPTETEWEYAARAGSRTAYPFGDDPARLPDVAWFEGNAQERPHPVGRKAANRWGLHDLMGNVAEWCLDLYDPQGYARLTRGDVGPVRVPSAARYPHVVRGGSWTDPAGRLRSAARRGSSPEWSRRDPQSPQSIWWHTDATFVGFRLVRAVDEQENLKGFRSTITRESPDKSERTP